MVGALGAKTIMIANSKVNLNFMVAFSRGILCNSLVCMAVWMCFACHSVTDKILAIIFPITGFVAMGFEHSIANMYFIPAGMIAQTNPDILKLIEATVDLSNLTTTGFFTKLNSCHFRQYYWWQCFCWFNLLVYLFKRIRV